MSNLLTSTWISGVLAFGLILGGALFAENGGGVAIILGLVVLVVWITYWNRLSKERIKLAATDPVQPKPTAGQQVVHYIVTFGSFALGRYLGLLVTVLIIAAVWLGNWFPDWYMKRSEPSRSLVNFIVRANILSWIFPILGVLTAFMAFGFSKHFDEKDGKGMKIWGWVGLSLSVLNAIAGIIQRV